MVWSGHVLIIQSLNAYFPSQYDNEKYYDPGTCSVISLNVYYCFIDIDENTLEKVNLLISVLIHS